MRTSRLRKLSADADALRRESPASRTLFYWPEQDSLVIIRIFMYDKEDEGSEKPWSMTCFCKKQIRNMLKNNKKKAGEACG